MLILSIEASTEYLSLAVGTGVRVHAYEAHAGQRHSEWVLGAVDRLLGEAGFAASALQLVAFGAGPGSFTGLRIACGVAQGLALAGGVPAVAVDSFRAIAAGCNDAERVAVAMDARMGEVYFAALERDDGRWREFAPAVVCQPGDVPRLPPGRWVAAGTGFAVHQPALLSALGTTFDRVDIEARPGAAAIDALARLDVAAGLAIDPALAAPRYVRDRVALTTLERRVKAQAALVKASP